MSKVSKVPWFVYILLCNDGSLYTGITRNLQDRFEKHQKGIGAKYTRSHGAKKIIYFQKYQSHSEAARREHEIKKLTRKEKERLVSINPIDKVMTKNEVASSPVHQIPADLRKVLASSAKARSAWNDITPLARNEWICWITSAKKQETRERKLKRIKEELVNGKRRPCCWGGCQHR